MVEIAENHLRSLNLTEGTEHGLLLRPTSIITDTFILIFYLQRPLSMFERMSIFFHRKMDVIFATDELPFQARYKL